jgi:hypothetical protein
MTKMLLKDHSLRDSLTFVQKENINYERLDNKSCLITIVKLVIFVGRVSTSNLVSTSKIGVQVEPLTHAFKTMKSYDIQES